MFDRFTIEARQVVGGAQELARRLGHGWTGCEHLLSAVAGSTTSTGSLLRDRGIGPQALEEAMAAVIGPAPGADEDKAVLATLGIDLDEVRHAAEATFGPGAMDVERTQGRRVVWHRARRKRAACTSVAGDRPLTPKAKRCLELALREALRLKHDHVGVEHIALALLARDDTAAWPILRHLGAVPGELRRAIEESHRRTA